MKFIKKNRAYDKKTELKFILNLFFTFLLFSCGHRQAPTGGEKDTLKPEIVAVAPEEFSDIQNQNVEISFSKPIDRTTIFSGFYVYPPILKKKFKWNGTTLTIKINEQLENDMNYFFSFSNKIKGEHKNELKENYLFVFRSKKLNENRIYGKILFEKKEDIIEPIIINLMTADSTKMFSRTVSGDFYQLQNLNKGAVILESFVDKNKNEIYDYGNEPYFRTEAQIEKNLKIDLNLIYADTIKPEIKSIKVLSENQLEVKFSEDISHFKRIHISSDDSLKAELSIFLDYLKDDKLSLVTAKMDSIRYNFQIENLEDLKKNINPAANLVFMGITVPDTVKPQIISISPRNGASLNSLSPEFKITFSELIPKNNLTGKMVSEEKGKIVPLKTISENGKEYILKPITKLKNYSSYKMEITAKDTAGNELIGKSDFVYISILRKNKTK